MGHYFENPVVLNALSYICTCGYSWMCSENHIFEEFSQSWSYARCAPNPYYISAAHKLRISTMYFLNIIAFQLFVRYFINIQCFTNIIYPVEKMHSCLIYIQFTM